MKILDLIVENSERVDTGIKSIDDIVRQFSSPSPFDDRLPIAADRADWETIHNPTRLRKIFVFSTIGKLKYFVSEIITYQQEINHSAKIIIDGLEASIETYTHDVNDVTNQDFKLAKFIDQVYEDTRYFSS